MVGAISRLTHDLYVSPPAALAMKRVQFSRLVTESELYIKVIGPRSVKIGIILS